MTLEPKTTTLCNIHKEQIDDLYNKIEKLQECIAEIKVSNNRMDRIERVTEKQSESIDKLLIKSVEHEENIKRLDKIDTRLAKVERYIFWGVGALGTLGSFTVIKFLYDVSSVLLLHKTM